MAALIPKGLECRAGVGRDLIEACKMHDAARRDGAAGGAGLIDRVRIDALYIVLIGP